MIRRLPLLLSLLLCCMGPGARPAAATAPGLESAGDSAVTPAVKADAVPAAEPGVALGRLAPAPSRHGQDATRAPAPFLRSAKNGPTAAASGQKRSGGLWLTRGEKAYLRSLPVLRIAFDPDWAPLTERGADGRMSGLLGEYLQRIQAELGVRIQPLPIRDGAQARAMMDAGRVDLAFYAAADAASDHGQASRTRPLITLPCVIVTRRGTPWTSGINDIRRCRTTVGFASSVDTAGGDTPVGERRLAGNDRQGLAAVKQGRVKAYAGNLATVASLLREPGYAGLHVAAPTVLTERIGLLVRDRYAPLAGLLDRAAATAMNKEERLAVHRQWLPMDDDFAITRPLLLWASIAACAIIATLVGACLSLRHEIRRRRAADDQLCEISRNLPAVVFKLRRTGVEAYRFTYVTGNPQPLFALEPRQIMEDPALLFARVEPSDHQTLLAAFERSARTMETVTADFQARGALGWRWISLRAVPRPVSEGVVHWSGYWVDATQDHEQNAALARAKEAAEAAATAQRNFLAVMSHEIRTPMAGLSGLLELLDRTPLTAQQRQLVSTSAESAASLRQILDDVLDFSKAEAGEMRLEAIDVDLRQVASGVLEVLGSQARAKGLVLDCRIHPGVAALHVGDPFRLRQILLNLVGNAIKFTQQGRVALEIAADAPEGDRDDAQTVRLRVTDTGLGIPAEQQARLFRPFVQADASTTRRYGGTGLGLSICRQLVEMMGGTLSLRSRPGAGTRLEAALPLRVRKRSTVDPDLMGRHLRLDIGEQALQASVREIMLGLGMREEHPPAGASTLRVTDLDETRPGDLVLRHHGAATETADTHLVHSDPLLYTALHSALRLAAGIDPPIAPASVPVATASARLAAPILVVEDHPTNRMLLARQLEELGYRFVLAADGVEALAQLDTVAPSLVLTDIRMPNLDGYMLAARIRERESGSGERLPIIAMTANVLADDVARGEQAGIDALLHKPVGLHELGRTLRGWLSPQALRAPGFDPELSRRLGADLPALVRHFIETTEVDLDLLSSAIAGRDARETASRIHRIAGALVHFNYHGLAESARDLIEAIQRDGVHAHVTECRRFVEEVETACESLHGLVDGEHGVPAGST